MIHRLLTTTIWVFAFALLLLHPTITFGEIVPLTILHTNDFHSYLSPNEKGAGGAAIIAGYYKKVRQEEPYVLILDAGDMVSGTPVSSLFKGTPVFHVMNHWGLDAAALGNHEFDYGWQRIEDYRRIAQFPLLCSNAFTMGSDGQLHLLANEPYLIFERGALKIGVIGVVAEWTPNMTVKEGTEGVTFVSSVDAVKQRLPELSPQVDLIILLSHVGVKHDQWLANEVPEIDLIVGGHSHTVLERAETVRGTYIVQTGTKGQYVGRIDLKADTEKDEIIEFRYQLLPVTQELSAPDPETQATVQHWESQVSELVDKPLAVAKDYLPERDMVTLAEAAYLEITGADYAYQNPGGTRGAIDAGPFTYRALWHIFPFENTLVTSEIKGSRIPPGFDGRSPIDSDQTYCIVTNSYVLDQWKREHPDLQDLKWEDTGIQLRDAVIRYMEKHKEIEKVFLIR